jgi:hypothetical protein
MFMVEVFQNLKAEAKNKKKNYFCPIFSWFQKNTIDFCHFDTKHKHF